MATRKPRRKLQPMEDLDAMNDRRRSNWPEQWERQSKTERQAMEARARQLISGEPIDWGESY